MMLVKKYIIRFKALVPAGLGSLAIVAASLASLGDRGSWCFVEGMRMILAMVPTGRVRG